MVRFWLGPELLPWNYSKMRPFWTQSWCHVAVAA
jgi:hypothetical protein